MNLPSSWRGLLLVCLLASTSFALESEVEDSNTESPLTETEIKTEPKTEILLKGKNETDLLIEEHSNSTELSRESRKIETDSSGKFFYFIFKAIFVQKNFFYDFSENIVRFLSHLLQDKRGLKCIVVRSSRDKIRDNLF